MKKVRTAGEVKHIESGNEQATLFRIQEILSEYRAYLITGILTDLPTYLQYKFYAKVDKEKLSTLREKLVDLSGDKVDLDRYQDVVHHISLSVDYRVPPQDFFREIDSLLENLLHPSKLTTIK